MRNLIGEPVK